MSFGLYGFLRTGGGLMLESKFQSGLIRELKEMFPGCIVLKNDPEYKQGIPDLIVLYEDKWAALECKRSKNSPHQPNQDYWVEKMDGMSFAAFVYPENREEILDGIQEAFRS